MRARDLSNNHEKTGAALVRVTRRVSLQRKIIGTQGVALDLLALLADKLAANRPQRRCLLDLRRR